jgi:hypothetical protein
MAAALRCKSDEGGGASVLSTDLRALRRGEEGGVGELRCRAWPHNERERRRASTAFDRKEKGEMQGGSGAGGATRRKEGGGLGAVVPHGGGWQGGGADGRRCADGSTRGQPTAVGVGRCRCAWEQGNGTTQEHVGRPGEGRS